MAKNDSILSFDKEALFHEHCDSSVIGYRESLFTKFARNMTSLLESQRPKRYSSNRGLLDTRKLHRYQTDDNVFYKKTSVPSSDTTFVFLVDASGSMTNRTSIAHNGSSLNRLDVCGAICSAFAKANKAVLGNRIKMEVFTKSEAGEVFDSFVKGYVPILSRVFSNTKNDTNWDKMCRLNSSAPIKIGDRPTGSYTPEFLLLPALMEWARKNLTTKNMVLINLTDGEVVHQFVPKESIEQYKDNKYGTSTYRATDKDTKSLRIKYLRGVPNTTLYMSGYSTSEWETERITSMYGTNAISASDDNFDTELFKTLNTLINQYA
tara:strand:+ start:2124 stop:3086 length:963 start_codon:yes stop_codon:yes gene_type:complete